MAVIDSVLIRVRWGEEDAHKEPPNIPVLGERPPVALPDIVPPFSPTPPPLEVLPVSVADVEAVGVVEVEGERVMEGEVLGLTDSPPVGV